MHWIIYFMYKMETINVYVRNSFHFISKIPFSLGAFVFLLLSFLFNLHNKFIGNKNIVYDHQQMIKTRKKSYANKIWGKMCEAFNNGHKNICNDVFFVSRYRLNILSRDVPCSSIERKLWASFTLLVSIENFGNSRLFPFWATVNNNSKWLNNGRSNLWKVKPKFLFFHQFLVY